MVKLLKLINEFYRAKGTPNSLKFLFRALYNEEIDIYYPKEDILKASDGKWILPLALRLDTNDSNIFNIEKKQKVRVQYMNKDIKRITIQIER